MKDCDGIICFLFNPLKLRVAHQNIKNAIHNEIKSSEAVTKT